METGTRIKDRYILKEFKGSGSFGEVWRAEDQMIRRDVALKIYLTLDPAGVDEFKHEYANTLDLASPYLLTPHYLDVWEHRPFLVMKYCEQGSSAKLAEKMDEYALWKFIHDVATGLDYLHSMPEPIIHQDIKPDNILMDGEGRFLITDFGISKQLKATMRKQSKTASTAGAIPYMAPERFKKDPVPVKASDIWSLGASIYELATGELPFSGLGGGMQLSGAEMPSLNHKWSKDMNMVMRSCLALETWDRPTAHQLMIFSDAIISGKPATPTWTLPTEKNPEPSGTSTPPTNGTQVERTRTRSNRKTVISMFVITSLVTIGFLWWLSGRDVESGDESGTADSAAVVTPSKEEHLNKDIPTRSRDSLTPRKEKKEQIPTDKVPGKPKIDKQSVPARKTEKDTNAERLKNALTREDYQEVQKLANQGYAPAYAPLAKYYLRNHDYSTAETYAKKAKAAGFSEGTSVLKTLENLGYYD